MTKRRRMKPHDQDSVPAHGLRGNVFPTLTAFLRGYLHQDFAAVHGSVGAAAEAFLADASEDEREQLVRELESLASVVTAQKTRALRDFIGDEIGSGWIPKSRREILELLAALRGRPKSGDSH